MIERSLINTPQVSVIIPTYNRPELVRRAIHSVMEQTFKDYEIVVVDDGSLEPVCVLENEFEHLRVVRHEKNLGEASARNTGIRESRGEFIAFLDSDDSWLPEKLNIQVSLMINNPSLGATTTGYYYLTEEGKSVEIPSRQQNWYKHLAKGLGLAPGTTLMVRRNLAVNTPYDVTLPRMADLDWLLRFSKIYPIDVVQKPLATIYRGGRPSAKNVETANLRIIEKYQQDFMSLGKFYGSQCIGKRYLEIATHYFRENQRKKGWHYLLKALKKNPFQRLSMYLRILDFMLGTSIITALKGIREKLQWRKFGRQ